MHAYRPDPSSSERADVCDTEHGACRENRFTFLKIFTALANVALRIAQVVDRYRAPSIIRVFMTNNGISAFRDWRTSHYAHRFAGVNRSGWKRPGRNFSNDLQR
jgi:hypothetical protein